MKKKNDGYLSKIKYWASEYGKAVSVQDVNAMDKAIRKLTYFNDKYGEWIHEKHGTYEPQNITFREIDTVAI